MAEWFQLLLQWVNAHPGWAGLVVFITAFVESLAIVGVIVPGVAILFTVGALIGAGALGFWPMVSWAVIGAVLGDGLSYWVGKRYQTQLTSVWPFSKHPATLQKGTAFFRRYGGKSVAMGRFFGPIRAVIPLVAGMMKMPTGRFVSANILSALAWAPAYLLPGMAFGASLELASEVAVSLSLLLIFLVISLWFLGWLSHRLFLLVQPHSQDFLKIILSLGQQHPRLARIAGALGDPGHPESAGLSALAGLLMISSTILILLVIIPINTLDIIDSSIHLPLQHLATPTGNHIMLAVSVLAGASTSLIILFATWTLLIIFRMPLAARHWLAGLGGIWLLTLAGEYLLINHPPLMRSIPDLYVLRASVMYGLAAVILSSSLAAGKRWRFYSASSMLVMAVTISQIYHGSSLVAVLHAVLLGLIWTAAVGVAYRTHAHQETATIQQTAILGASIICLACLSAASTGAPIAPPPMLKITGSLSMDSWWNGEWQQLPSSRDDFSHLKNHPLNLQYQGDIKTLSKSLAENGWRAVDADPGVGWLKFLSPSTDIASLPILPHSHEGRYESHQFIKPFGNRRLSLYLWPGRHLLQPYGEIIWLGEAGHQIKQQKLGLFSYPVTERDHRPALRQLADDLANSRLQSKLVANDNILLLRAPGHPVK